MKILENIILALIFTIALHASPPAQDGQIRLRAWALGTFPTTVGVESGGTNMVLLHSEDLKTWQPLVTVFARVPYFRVVDRSTLGTMTREKYYRAVNTPESV